MNFVITKFYELDEQPSYNYDDTNKQKQCSNSIHLKRGGHETIPMCTKVVWKVRRILFARIVRKVRRINFVITKFYEFSEQPSYI